MVLDGEIFAKILIYNVYIFFWKTLRDLLGPINDQMSLFEQFCIKELSCKNWHFCCSEYSEIYSCFDLPILLSLFLYHILFDLDLINSEPHAHVFCQLCLRMGQVYPKKKAKTLKLYRRTTCDKKISLTTIWLVKKNPKIHHMFIDRCVEFTMCAHDSRRVRLMVLDSSVLSLTSLGFC